MKRLNDWLGTKPILFCILYSGLLTFILEVLNRRSVFSGALFLAKHPVLFHCNLLVILLSMLLSLFFKRRIFVLALVSIFWLGMAIVNFVVLGFRTTPLAAIDFYILKPVFSIFKIYLSVFHLVLIVLAVLLVVSFAVLLYIKAPKHTAKFKRALASVSSTALVALLVFPLSIQAEATSNNGFANLANAYQNYGFAYCFTTSFLDTGIRKPADYSEEQMQSLSKKLQQNKKRSSPVSKSAKNANVVFVQLESFFDPYRLGQFSYSQDPTPIFRMMKKYGTSGFLEVPSIGAGTANTEFELLTGMSLDYFGPGEYPYKTVLQDTTCESIAYLLKERGYATHAIHNNTGTFYDRHIVFPNLGFDTFIPIEHMLQVPKNDIGWAKDSILTGEILSCLRASDARDFVYAISVQPHGKYPSKMDESWPIKVSADLPLSEAELAAYSYYVNQIKEVDNFVGDLITQLQSWDEPVILVVYGDHFPSIALTEQYLTDGHALQTEYAIWSNFPMETEDEDLFCYQLSSSVLSKMGIHGGVVNALHQNLKEDEQYQTYLEQIEYDLLFGENYLSGGQLSYKPLETKLGILDITIDSVAEKDGFLYLTGSGFTPYSKVYLGGSAVQTQYLSKNYLRVEKPGLKEETLVQVFQVGEDSIPLGSSNKVIYIKP